MNVVGGSRIDDIELYDSDELALKRIEEFNSYNTAKEAPDWYMIASLGEIVNVTWLGEEKSI